MLWIGSVGKQKMGKVRNGWGLKCAKGVRNERTGGALRSQASEIVHAWAGLGCAH